MNVCQFYFITTPKDIIVYDKGREVVIDIDLKFQQNYYYDEKKIPPSFYNCRYSDRLLEEKRVFEKIDLWSVGLCGLAMLSRYEDVEDF